MIKLKSDKVNLNNVHPKIYWAISQIGDIYEKVYGLDLTITSCRDSKHGEGSLHYVGKAFDIRIWGVATPERLTKLIQDRLGDDFDVVYEVNHIHCEFDPDTI